MKKRVITAAIIGAVAIPLFIIGKWPLDIALIALLTGAAFEFIRIQKFHIITKVGFTCLVGLEVLLAYLSLHADVGFTIYAVWGLIILLPLLYAFGAFIFDKGEKKSKPELKGAEDVMVSEEGHEDELFNSEVTVVDVKENTRENASLLNKRENGVNATGVFLMYTLAVIYGFAGSGLLIFNTAATKYRIFILLLLILPTIFCDMGAFFVGKSFGKHKLIPEVSPNKTVEGAVGGYVAGLIAGAVILGIFYKYFDPMFIVAVLVLPLTCQVGDLFFSFIKRMFGVKDFSNLLPGHGGINDRIDSLILNTIVLFVIGLF